MKLIRVLLMAALHFALSLGQLPSQDIMALLEFKKGIKHDPTGYVIQSWNLESTDTNGCPSSWNGIMCDGVGNVAALVLDNLGLSADDVDLSVLSNLTMLVKLSLSNNSISGKLPYNIADFKSLEYLDLSDNLFSSHLPPQIGQLGSLKNLSIAGNNLSGSLSDITLSGLTSIKSLDLSRNFFSGVLPSSLTKLRGLVYLNLSKNGFTGNIPKGFENLENLEVLDLHGNVLGGELDSMLLLLTTASHVDLSGNMLVTSAASHRFLPNGISESVQYLNLSGNQLSGSIMSGDEAEMFGNLKVLDLSFNQLSGELPGFHFVYDLQVLKLGNNRFSGFIPSDLLKGDTLVLTELDLSANKLTGTINTITSTALRVLNLSSNSLSGELPSATGSCTVLDLSNNQFEGNLSRMHRWGDIELLVLSRNRLTGPIPEIAPQFLRLNYLNLSGNNLTGSLPKLLSQFPKLTVLDLSFNRFNGPFPTALLTLSPSLKELYLQYNALSGAIGSFSPPLSNKTSNLHVLDLSYNQLSGPFPDGFGSLVGLQVVDMAGNRFSGSLPTSVGNITTLSFFDLSHNHFTGPLPNNLPKSSLQIFNASYNDFSGVIPENLMSFPKSSFYPGNSGLEFPNASNIQTGNCKRKSLRTFMNVVIIVSCVLAVAILISLSVFVYYMHKSRSRTISSPSGLFNRRDGNLVISAEDLMNSRMGESLEPEKKVGVAIAASFSPAKTSHLSWSSESPDQLPGELYFLDDTVSFAPQELSKAPAEVLGRSSHGTSYKATLECGMVLTVKWLREGVAKEKKDFAKEAKKFVNIRHPNVVGLRGYYWGPTLHEKLILSDYISPGSLACFLYDRVGRTGVLTWPQRLKIAVDVSRGLNYLHLDREFPHGNLKASNVMLDGQDLNARIADYALHLLMTQAGTTQQILDAGALGYLSPELAAQKKPMLSFKSDVYALGVILLELLTGKCAGDNGVMVSDGGASLTDWVESKVGEGRGSDCYDALLLPEMGNPLTEKQMKEVMKVGVRCICSSPGRRPDIKTVYEDLSSI
ncbi:unnamed protein product [Cuscuta epithymum]|uniref:Protein kinase domain-containing protein n=1 Tax=Cuscuta epithymum TaxID=186058 RepID=A0AAV0EDD7_9ASTE|nr:unnamed protein product [Cuscuta epithymum]